MIQSGIISCAEVNARFLRRRVTSSLSAVLSFSLSLSQVRSTPGIKQLSYLHIATMLCFQLIRWRTLFVFSCDNGCYWSGIFLNQSFTIIISLWNHNTCSLYISCALVLSNTLAPFWNWPPVVQGKSAQLWLIEFSRIISKFFKPF